MRVVDVFQFSDPTRFANYFHSRSWNVAPCSGKGVETDMEPLNARVAVQKP